MPLPLKVLKKNTCLLLDPTVKSISLPLLLCKEDNVVGNHAASAGQIDQNKLFYLMSRGLSESEATEMIVMGFVEPFTKELPMEYAVELNRLISYEMEGSVG